MTLYWSPSSVLWIYSVCIFVSLRLFYWIFKDILNIIWCQVFAFALMMFVELPPCSSSITMLYFYHVWINLWPATRDKCLASGRSITMYNNVLQCITADITSSLRGDQDTATITTWRPDWLSTGPRFRSRRMGNNINSLLFLLVIITPGFCLLLNCFCFSARNFC